MSNVIASRSDSLPSVSLAKLVMVRGFVPLYAGHAEIGETVARYLLTHYVTVCEGFSYATAEPRLVTALHAWFDAQLMDHGANAHR